MSDAFWSEVLSLSTLQEPLRALIEWLRKPGVRTVVGETVPIPLSSGEKKPMVAHRLGQWSWKELGDFILQHDNINEPHDTWGLLLDRVCAIDADDMATVAFIEERVPELASAPCQKTKRGMHYFFARPAWADDEGFYDGAAQNRQHADEAVRALKVDFKSVTANMGTRGVLQVSPSAGKEWLRPPWSWPQSGQGAGGATYSELPELPRHLAMLVAHGRSLPERLATEAATRRDKLRRSRVLVGMTAADKFDDPARAVVAEEEHDRVEALLESLSPDRWDTYADWRCVLL